MLYESWRQVARTFSREIALRDLAGGRQWTFQELAAATDRPEPGGGKVAFPQGLSAGFVISILKAWRSSQIV